MHSINCDIRPAGKSDQNQVFDLANHLHASIIVDDKRFPEAFAMVINNENHCCLVAQMTGAVLGYCSGHKHMVLTEGEYVAFLDEIVVSESHRRKGIGSTLLRGFEKWALAADCTMVTLATGGATGFYEKQNYTTRAGYFKKRI